jgi:hypothetical protein
VPSSRTDMRLRKPKPRDSHNRLRHRVRRMGPCCFLHDCEDNGQDAQHSEGDEYQMPPPHHPGGPCDGNRSVGGIFDGLTALNARGNRLAIRMSLSDPKRVERTSRGSTPNPVGHRRGLRCATGMLCKRAMSEPDDSRDTAPMKGSTRGDPGVDEDGQGAPGSRAACQRPHVIRVVQDQKRLIWT